MSRRRIPRLVDGWLTLFAEDGEMFPPIAPGSSDWWDWLADERHASFSLDTAAGSVTLRRERQRNGLYWYAYRWLDGRLRKSYIGKSEQLTAERLQRLGLDGMSATEPLEVSPTVLATQDVHGRADVHLRLLGTPFIERAGQRVDGLHTRALTLLAYLATHTLPQPRERLIALLWPESAEEAGRKNLRNLLWTIRTQLGPEVVQVEESRLTIGQMVNVDVWVFERLVEQLDSAMKGMATADGWDAGRHITDTRLLLQALSCYRGPLLDGLVVADALEAQQWLLLERERLGQMALRLCLALLDAYRIAGEWSNVLRAAYRALRTDPLQEPVYRAIMEAHARLGERTEALRQYDVLRVLLARELDVEPLPETEALRTAISSGALQPAPGELVSPPAHHRQVTIVPAHPFVGRRTEWLALDDELRCVQQGQARVVLLTGELGIGKSRLWQEWKTGLPASAQVLDLRCFEVDRAQPQGPFIGWFGRSDWVRQLFLPSSPLPQIWKDELLRLIPASAGRRSADPNVSPPISLVPETERSRLFEALAQCLIILGMQPLVLFLDDSHWIDSFTLDWLGYLVDRFVDTSLLIILAYRPEEAPSWLSARAAHWLQRQRARHIPLPHLTRGESAQLLAALGGAEQRAEDVYARSAGNPYFVSELVHAAPESIPAALADLVRTRLDLLNASVRQILQTAAVLEPDIDFATLRRTSGRSEDELLDALDILFKAAILSEQHEQYFFVHPLVAEVIREHMGSARRKALHRRAAQALEAVYGAQVVMFAGRLARHYAEAGEAEPAARYLDMAAENARRMAAWDEVLQFSRRALQLVPTSERWMLLGRALFWKGQLDEARESLNAALLAAEAVDNEQQVATVSFHLAATYLAARQIQEAAHWVRRGLNALGREDIPPIHTLAHTLSESLNQQEDRAPVEIRFQLLERVQRLVAIRDPS